ASPMTRATGATVARSDDAPLVSVAASPRFQEAARSKTTTVSVAISVALQRPLLFVNAPILGPGGAFAGVVSVAVEPEQIAMALARSTEPGEQAYIVDQTGRVMVPPDPGRMAVLTDRGALPAMAALLEASGDSGTVQYGTVAGEQLAAYARVPGTGWGVVVEAPRTLLLAPLNPTRTTAFALLMLIIGVSSVSGILLA